MSRSIGADYPDLIAMARKRGFRSVLWSPLMREGLAVGMISVTRAEPGHFAPTCTSSCYRPSPTRR